MPEGPEIRRAADRLSRALAGRRALAVRFAADAFPHLRRYQRVLDGATITAVVARSKAMLTHFANGWTIYSHNQLYGEWALHRGAPPPTHLQERLVIRTASRSAVLYSASAIEVLRTDAVARHPYIARLGVELLDPAVGLEAVRAQIGAPRFARRRLDALLLDQGFLAGIGNYLRSDILFAAGLHPQARPADLSDAQRLALARAALRLTRQSYRTGGVTNDPAVARRLKAAGWDFARYRHRVFERAGAPCHVCGTPIRRLDSGGRGLFLCERCQPPAPSGVRPPRRGVRK
ncbi:MAG: endonuclease VIII [Burkholderiales bacterium]|nr:endonuclease VIII [Burkholderiales bacterium]